MLRKDGQKGAAILHVLQDIQGEKFREFCHKLTDSGEQQRIRVSEVESKSRVDVAELLVSRCTVSGAVDRAIRVLRHIGCYDEADRLAAEVADRPRRALQGHRPRSPPQRLIANGHFVDRHRNELIDRVSNIGPILDHLLQEGVLQQEQYDRAMDISPTQAQMRFLFSGPLRSGGDSSKDILMDALCVRESFLVQDLWKTEG